MIKVDGYMAFHGVMMITPVSPDIKPFELLGDWLYKPDMGCWYGLGSSFAKEICTIKEEN